MADGLTLSHFDASELRQAMRNGFDEPSRLRALAHLGGGCTVCRGQLEQLARQETAAKDEGQVGDFVGRALRRWIGVLRQEPVVSAHMTPIHLYWAEHISQDPSVFPRLVLEEAQLIDAEASYEAQSDIGGPSSLETALETLSDPRLLLRMDEARWHDLRALAHSYLGYCLCSRWGYFAASDHFHLARDQLRQGSTDHEIRAIVEMLRADVMISACLSVQGEWHREGFEKHLRRFLEARSSPGHLAELRIHQGLACLRSKEYSRGRERFVEGAAHLPEDCARSRFFAVYRAATLSFFLNDPEGARRYLPEAEHLVELHGFASAGAELLRLRGNLERLAGNHRQAEDYLRQALDLYLRDGDRKWALQTLRDLRTLYLAADRSEELPELQEEFFTLIRHPGARPWGPGQISTVVRWAEELEIADLEALRKELCTRPEETEETA